MNSMSERPKFSFGKYLDDSHATTIRKLTDWKTSSQIDILSSIKKHLVTILPALVEAGFAERRDFQGAHKGRGFAPKYEYKATEKGMEWANAYVASLYKKS